MCSEIVCEKALLNDSLAIAVVRVVLLHEREKACS